MMLTVFDGIPDIFVERYDALFRKWGREFARRGRKVAIVFDPMPGEERMVDEEGRTVLVGAWLTAEVEDHWMVVRPASEADRKLHACRARVSPSLDPIRPNETGHPG
jgi:hypothetical protein